MTGLAGRPRGRPAEPQCFPDGLSLLFSQVDEVVSDLMLAETPIFLLELPHLDV